MGTTIARKYRVERILGKGGMGVVYAATQIALDRKVALKMLLPAYAERPDVARRFLTEARVAAKLEHPNVVDVIDVDEDGGEAFIVLEHLQGEALSALLQREKRLSPARCAGVLLPVMDALALAHSRSIVHRDVKPDNVFLAHGPTGEVPKLLDFGIAKVKSETDEGTATGTMLGTVRYMAPEQARGEAHVGPPADVWSMGVVWYECLSGAAPFDGANAHAMLFAITTGTCEPLASRAPEVPEALVRVVERAMARDASARFADMGQFALAVREALGRAVPSLPAPPPAPPQGASQPVGARVDPHGVTHVSVPAAAPTIDPGSAPTPAVAVAATVDPVSAPTPVAARPESSRTIAVVAAAAALVALVAVWTATRTTTSTPPSSPTSVPRITPTPAAVVAPRPVPAATPTPPTPPTEVSHDASPHAPPMPASPVAAAADAGVHPRVTRRVAPGARRPTGLTNRW